MNYILRHTGAGEPDITAVKKVLAENAISILDSSSLPKMALLDGITDMALPNVKKQLPGGYELFPMHDKAFAVPDTRQKVSPAKKNK